MVKQMYLYANSAPVGTNVTVFGAFAEFILGAEGLGLAKALCLGDAASALK